MPYLGNPLKSDYLNIYPKIESAQDKCSVDVGFIGLVDIQELN
jgi:hypothetical protein